MIETKVFLDEADLYENKPLFEYIMRYLMHHNIMGATLFQAVEGFGHNHHLHHSKILGSVDDEPLMIVFIDEDEKIRSVLPHIKEILKEGLITLCKVEIY